jgi:hypothetical protein
VYSLASAVFRDEFGEQLNLTFVNPADDLGKILNNGRHGEIVLSDLWGFLRTCIVQIFSNQYKTFALIYPRRAYLSRRTVHFNNWNELLAPILLE